MRAQCCICAELFVNNETNIAATPCGHVFHEHCLARWLQASMTCPSCRKKVVERAIIPKLFFDIAEDEDPDNVNPEKLSNELQSLRTKVTELKQQKSKEREKEKEVRESLRKKAEELEAVSQVLQREQETGVAQQRLLQSYELQQQVHKEERAEFLRLKKKITELRHVDALVSGSMKDCEEMLQQYSSGDRGSLHQLVKYSAILKREYEQVKVEKRTLKEHLDMHKKSSYTASRDLSQLQTSHKQLQEQLSRSEEDLKQAEKTSAALKAKVAKLQYAKKHPATTSGSFLDSPKTLDLSDNALAETPKLRLNEGRGREPFITPTMSRPSGSSFIDLAGNNDSGGCGSGALNQSFDLFAESPQTQVRKTCEENRMKVVKISTAATSNKAAKRVRSDEDELDSFPLSTLNIMKKRDKPGQLLGSSVTRKDYNGLGGTSSFTQPVGQPKFGPLGGPFKFTSKAKRTVKPMKKIMHPALPTLDGFVALTD